MTCPHVNYVTTLMVYAGYITEVCSTAESGEPNSVRAPCAASWPMR
jgi:hypothetical protein